MKNIFFEKIFIFQAMVFKFGYLFGFIEASNKCKISAQYVHKYACCYCFQNQSVGQKPDLTGNIQYILHILFNIIGYIPCIGIYPLVSTDISLC